MDQVAEAVIDTRRDLAAYSADHPEFRDVGIRCSTPVTLGLRGAGSDQTEKSAENALAPFFVNHNQRIG